MGRAPTIESAAPRSVRHPRLSNPDHIDIMHAIKRSIAAVLAVPLLLALPACDKKKEEEKKEEEKPKVEKKELSALFTGDKVTMPPPFGSLKLGATFDENKGAAPGMADDGDIETEEFPDSVWFKASFDDDTKRLTRVYLNMPKAEAVKLMTAQWGEPKKGEDMGKEVLWWFNPEAELRVSLADSGDTDAHVEFTHYWSVEKFLGAEGPELAFQKDAPLLGLSAADLEAKYGSWIKKTSAEEAAKQKEDIEKLAGAEAGALMGKPTADIDLEYPPTEWGSYWTPVHFMWTDEGKIDRVWFGIDFEPHPAAKDEIMALLEKKWGEPKEEEEYGDKVYVFSEEPFIKVEEDTISKKWDIFIEPKR